MWSTRSLLDSFRSEAGVLQAQVGVEHPHARVVLQVVLVADADHVGHDVSLGVQLLDVRPDTEAILLVENAHFAVDAVDEARSDAFRRVLLQFILRDGLDRDVYLLDAVSADLAQFLGALRKPVGRRLSKKRGKRLESRISSESPGFSLRYLQQRSRQRR